LKINSLEKPGLYRDIKQEYYDRVEAIDFTLARDDGMNPQNLSEAEIVLTDVSRVEKTPLSIYLAMFGWKVANVPIISDVVPPTDLFKIDHQRIFGLTIGINQLLSHRIKRMESLGMNENDHYLQENMIKDDIQNTLNIFKKGRFIVINVTNKPIESSASEIIRIISSRFKVSEKKILSVKLTLKIPT
jgi:regulator of PEP synthase PpsR (kinase-PPPase family)